MTFDRRAACLGAALAALAAAPMVEAQTQQPVEIVRAIYAAYEADKGESFKKPFTPAIVGALKKAEPIEFDYFVNGQDYTITEVSVTAVKTEPERVTVEARFKNSGAGQRVLIDFQLLSGKWLIRNVTLPDNNFDLRRTLKLRG